MNEHYFSKQPQSKSKRETWQTTLRNYNLSFTTDFGVFSREKVDFGSRVLIESFIEPAIDGKILDLGCGYGPVGLAVAASFPERQIVMADINERAISLAKHNANINQITNVQIVASDRFSQISDTFAAILLNPPIRAGKKVVYDLFTESYHSLKKHGEFWIVIQKKQGAPSAAKKLEELFKNVSLIERKKGYHIYKAQKLD
ncbi:MAG TPA: class I SAM-dependent methyltransferase [Bacillota bacterium]|nr:class I SAM-dependent methyltransferase [Bacillota bacterium]